MLIPAVPLSDILLFSHLLLYDETLSLDSGLMSGPLINDLLNSVQASS